MIRRIFLFILTNIAIIVMGTIILGILQRVFGINITGTLHGSWLSLAIFALIYGFLGSFVSLQLSRWMAKKAYRMKMITEETLGSCDEGEKLVFRTVSRIAQSENIALPEVGIYDSPEVNAFATGPSKNRSLVAASRGLVNQMKADEIEGVIGHEMAHILNGDMVTMTLLQGIINAFVIFLSRAIAHIVALSGRGDREGSNHIAYFFTTILLEILLGLLGSIIVMAYSRRREFAADKGSAGFVGKTKMIDALRALQRIHDTNVLIPGDPKVATLKIDGKTTGMMRLFASHPDLEERIQALLKN